MAAAAGGAAQWVQARVASNGLAVLTLDRPKALNAMTLEMDLVYKMHLDNWAAESAVQSVLVEGSTARAFCAGMDIKGVAASVKEDRSSTLPHQAVNWVAGGDIKQLQHHDKKPAKIDAAAKVFAAEYSLICEIARYKKPYVSLMDGVTMGFGIGLSGHGRYRVVTERTVLAMPENAIGLFPDVGFAHLAARSPGNGALGAYIALTGTRISNPADALYIGLATHYVPSASLAALKEALLSLDMSNDAHQKVEDLLSKYSEIPESQPQLKTLLPNVIDCFGDGKSVIQSIEALKNKCQSSDSAVATWAKHALEGLRKGVPFGLSVTQRHYASVAAAASDPAHALSQIEGVMREEYYLGIKTSTRNDFTEGVRALLIDKDQNPKWQPATLEEIDQGELEGVFHPMDEHPLPF